jgi:CheY-like chemotaxis protein
MHQHLLVVDDDDEVRAFLVGALEESGYAVSTAPDGTSALQLLSERDFALILIDFALPGMTGTELVERIREHNPAQKLLLISGYAGTAALQRAAGDVPIVPKPVALTDLAAAVKAALGDQADAQASSD